MFYLLTEHKHFRDNTFYLFIYFGNNLFATPSQTLTLLRYRIVCKHGFHFSATKIRF